VRIRSDLETNLLVEAGAGSGKTTALVERMVALVRTGTARVEELAAVTFTRKAAAELRERFQIAVEREVRSLSATDPTRVHLSEALRDMDRAFLGTIHAFSARLLRERPLEAGLDPGFEEMLEYEEYRLRRQFWAGLLERVAADEDPLLRELADVGLRPHQLERGFDQLVDNPDVRFAQEAVPRPAPQDIATVRGHLEEVMGWADQLMPEEEPQQGWGPLQRKVRSLWFSKRHLGWDEDSRFFEALRSVVGLEPSRMIRLNRWAPDRSRQGPIRGLKEAFLEFGREDGPAHRLLDQWLAHRYPLVIRFLQRAAQDYQAERRRRGRLSFADLLTLAVGLLRTHPRARRDLGRRYRRLLIDEFQDTDPIQAEIAFLLASEPRPEELEEGRALLSWPEVDLRPGALFVVGDPKQSIYRFRRADIQMYEAVRRRFEKAGDVLRLEANFRSLVEIASLVNEVFDSPDLFPRERTGYQAEFAPLLAHRQEEVPAAGVHTYSIRLGHSWSRRHAREEARRLAAWIRTRVDSGERLPGDFLILTRKKSNLEEYARALEERDLPVEVSGAGVGLERELSELLLLLRTLVDPGDPVKVVATLTGLFFGIDYQQLASYRLEENRFDFTRDDELDGTPIGQALSVLRRWWLASRREPADVFVGRLVDEIGLLPYAASGDLGPLRVGSLGYALDAIRARAVSGDTSLVGAIESLETALSWDEAEAPFEPGREDAVRVMNLHKAKGLEAHVVILAEPGRAGAPRPALHVSREVDGEAVGYLEVDERDGRGRVPLARPLDWRGRQEEEERFRAAEENRVLYVAVTRARDELVVGRCAGKADRSPWGALDAWLEDHAGRLGDLSPSGSGGRRPLKRSHDDIAADVRRVDGERARRAAPSYRIESVTEIAKREEPGWPSASSGPTPTPVNAEAGAFPRARPAAPAEGSRTMARGFEWGSVVHAALASAARGTEGKALEAVCRSLLVEYERPVDDRGEPLELWELLGLVRAVRSSDLWARAMAADRCYPEIGFAAPRAGSLSGVNGAGGGPGPPGSAMSQPIPEWVEGVIDLAFREDGGWVIADYKTDVGDDPDFERRATAYRRQVELYAECWAELTGDPVKERVLIYTARGRAESW
jgi:ATP-dependent helicase/nuclease subunit A